VAGVWRFLVVLTAISLVGCTDSSDDSAPETTITLDPQRFDDHASDRCSDAEPDNTSGTALVAAYDTTLDAALEAFMENEIDPGFVRNRDQSVVVCWFDTGNEGQVVIYQGDHEFGTLPAGRTPTRP
jgi:hypothetical protein